MKKHSMFKLVTKKRAKYFDCPLANKSINLKTPENWWDSHGDENLELQKFIIHVLSLTCSSSKCEHIWCSFEIVS